MHAQSFDQESHSSSEVFRRFSSDFPYDLRVIVSERSHEDFVDLAFVLLALQTLLNHIGRELELTQVDEVLADVLEDLLVQVRLFQLQHVLDKVIAVGIFNQVAHLRNYLSSQFDLLVHAAFLQASLHDTAAMLLLADVHTVSDAGIKDKLSVHARF